MIGFTHFWGASRKGSPAVMRKTMKSRLARGIQKIEQWCRTNRHTPVREQWRKLCEKLRGHYGYYGITGNARSLGLFLYNVRRSWHRWLNRRNSRGDFMWARFQRFIERYALPLPKIIHSVFKGK